MGNSHPSASLCAVLAVLFPGEMKHDRCADYAWFSGRKVTPVSFLGRGAALLLLGESRPSQGCHTLSLPPHAGLGYFISGCGGGSCTRCCTSLSWLQPVQAFPSAALWSCRREIPAGFLGFGGSAPTQGFRRGARAEQGEPRCGCCISASCSGLWAPPAQGAVVLAQ